MIEHRLPTLRLSSAELVARLMGPAERALRMACADLGVVPAMSEQSDALASEAHVEPVLAWEPLATAPLQHREPPPQAERAVQSMPLTPAPSRATERLLVRLPSEATPLDRRSLGRVEHAWRARETRSEAGSTTARPWLRGRPLSRVVSRTSETSVAAAAAEGVELARTPLRTTAALPRGLDTTSPARTSRPVAGEAEVERTDTALERPRLRVRAPTGSAPTGSAPTRSAPTGSKPSVATADSAHVDPAALESSPGTTSSVLVPTTTIPSPSSTLSSPSTTARPFPQGSERVLVSVVHPSAETEPGRTLESSPSRGPVEGPRAPHVLAPDHERIVTPSFAELADFDEPESPKSPATASPSPTKGLDEHALAACIAAAARRHGIEVL